VSLISFPRRRQYRHVAATACCLALAPLAVGAGLAVLSIGGGAAALVPLAAAAGLVAAGRHSMGLAARYRVGADAERAVRRQLNRLRADGWVVHHGVCWPRGGDIDHLLAAPNGLGFAVETKTRGFNFEHLDRTAGAARWAARRHWGGSRRVVPVLCVVRNHHLEHQYGAVVVVSLDRLLPALQARGEC
jgi:hypothetical protein